MNFAKTSVCILLLSVFAAIATATSAVDDSNAAFRSAFLQDRWPESRLTQNEVDRQLKTHFDVVTVSYTHLTLPTTPYV